MSFEIVTGRSKSGKSEYVYKQISSLVSMGKEVMLIVPEQFSHSAEKNLLKYVDAIKDGSCEVFSFNHLAMITESRLGYADIPRVNAVGKAVTIKNILRTNEFSFYVNAGRQNGFADMVASSISEFKKYNINPELLKKIASETDDEVLSMKLNDLEKIYSKYEECVSKGFRDGDDMLSVLSGYLEESNIYSEKYVFFDGFSTFVPQEYQVIKAMCSKCRSVTVALTYDKAESNSTLFMPAFETFKTLKSLVGENFKHTHLSNTYYTSTELKFLEKKLYSFSSEAYTGSSKDIKVFSLQNPLNESENCARNILKLVRENQYRFKDIGVVCSDIEAYQRHLENAFEDCGIDYFIDNKNDILNHHLISFFLGILEVYINEYDYSSIFAYLKTSFVNAEPGSIALLEKFILKSNIRRRGWLDDERWNALLEANFPGDDKTQSSLNFIRDKYIVPLAVMHEKIKGRNTVKHNASVLYEFIESIKMPAVIAEYIKMFSDIGEFRLSKEYEKIWDIIVQTLDEITNIAGDIKVNVTEFYDLLLTGFTQHKVGYIPVSSDTVTVGNTERTRFDRIKVLFVLGVNEGLFPLVPKAEGVLGDADKYSMKKCNVEFSTTTEISAYYSQYASYSTFTMPTEKLYVSYSKSDNNFKTLRKSYLIDRICKLFNVSEMSEKSIPGIDMLTGKKSVREGLSKNVAAFCMGQSIDDFWYYVYKLLCKDGFCDKLTCFMNSNNLFTNISDKNAKELSGLLSYTSVSKIERYMACKYAYFMDYVLKIDNPKDKVVDALDIGNVTHGILELLCKEYGKTREDFVNAKDSDVLASIDKHLDNYLSEIFKGTDEISFRDSYTLKRLRDSVFLCFNSIKYQFADSRFEPMGYEIEFNNDSPVGPIEIYTKEGEKVTLTGKIDRADIYTTDNCSYIRVIDYKTGSKSFRLDDILYGLSVQLMVYLNKLVESNEKYTYGGAFYFPVTDVIIKRDEKTSEADVTKDINEKLALKGVAPYDEKVIEAYDSFMADQLSNPRSKHLYPAGFEIIHKYLKNKISDICSEMLRCDFEIKPYKKGNFTPCEYCNYKSVCRFDSNTAGNSYVFYKSKTNYDEILKEMEEDRNGE